MSMYWPAPSALSRFSRSTRYFSLSSSGVAGVLTAMENLLPRRSIGPLGASMHQADRILFFDPLQCEIGWSAGSFWPQGLGPPNSPSNPNNSRPLEIHIYGF